MDTPPLGLHLARTARLVSAAFDRALVEAGGSAPVWQVLLLVRSGNAGTQSEMAKAMGITAATLTHHLNAMERDGLVTRTRSEHNRRIHRVELTAAGVALFDRLRSVAVAFDRDLRARLGEEDAAHLAKLLDRLQRTE
jgi:MarR family transcriptional regulator, transcriptional regulator for hemolysin